MVRVQANLWINKEKVVDATVWKGNLVLSPDNTNTYIEAYKVEEEYLADVCSAFNLPFNIIEKIRDEQRRKIEAAQ